MKELARNFMARKKKEMVFALVIAIFSIVIAISGFVLSCVYFETIGKGLFYLYSFLSLFLFGMLAIWGIIGYWSNRYEISFWKKKSKDEEISGRIIKVSSYTVDRHFDSLKIALEGGRFVYWFSPFGNCPFKDGETYRLQTKDNWISGWEKVL